MWGSICPLQTGLLLPGPEAVPGEVLVALSRFCLPLSRVPAIFCHFSPSQPAVVHQVSAVSGSHQHLHHIDIVFIFFSFSSPLPAQSAMTRLLIPSGCRLEYRRHTSSAANRITPWSACFRMVDKWTRCAVRSGPPPCPLLLSQPFSMVTPRTSWQTIAIGTHL